MIFVKWLLKWTRQKLKRIAPKWLKGTEVEGGMILWVTLSFRSQVFKTKSPTCYGEQYVLGYLCKVCTPKPGKPCRVLHSSPHHVPRIRVMGLKEEKKKDWPLLVKVLRENATELAWGQRWIGGFCYFCLKLRLSPFAILREIPEATMGRNIMSPFV